MPGDRVGAYALLAYMPLAAFAEQREPNKIINQNHRDMKKIWFMTGLCALFVLSGCNSKKNRVYPDVVRGFAKVSLTADLSKLTDNEKQMLAYLCDAAEIMDEIFWLQAYGPDKDAFLDAIEDDTDRAFAEINYGPWSRLENNEPFIKGVGPKPAGSGFYPKDMTKEEFEALADENKTSGYTVLRRDENGKLVVKFYHEEYAAQIEKAATLIEKAAALCDHEGFKNYLTLRAKALRTDDYFESDMAWMNVKGYKFDFVAGPTENYEDALFGYKTAHESFLLIKDEDWSAKLAKFAVLLPDLQKSLPVEDKYKSETPGLESDMNVYDAVLYRGDCNSGSKTIAINLPNDERVHIQKGTRKLQLKNAMKAKFDRIMLPISGVVMDGEQKEQVKFNSFFENVTFHEVAHGMGIKNTINGKGTVRQALKETYATIEEAKADIMGLYLVDRLHEMGELNEDEVSKNYITFFAGIFRSVRFGAASAHGKANMLCFNYMAEHDVFTRTVEGIYSVDVEKMKAATASLLADILKVQGDGDYDKAQKWIAEKSVVNTELQSDLNRIADANIPKDIYYEQGKSVLGL